MKPSDRAQQIRKALKLPNDDLYPVVQEMMVLEAKLAHARKHFERLFGEYAYTDDVCRGGEGAYEWECRALIALWKEESSDEAVAAESPPAHA